MFYSKKLRLQIKRIIQQSYSKLKNKCRIQTCQPSYC